MPLVVEDGSLVAGANTYQDLDTAKAAATERGLDLGTDDAKITAGLLAAASRVDTARIYNGVALGEMAFPRRGLVDNDGRVIAENAVPRDVLLAQLLYTAEFLRQPYIGVSAADPSIKRVKADTVEVEYVDGRPALPPVPQAEALLGQYAPISTDWQVLQVHTAQPVYPFAGTWGWPW